MRYRFIQVEKAHYPVGVLCRCLKVARSGFYAWQRRIESKHTVKDRTLAVGVRAVYQEHRGRYGSPRVWAELRASGVQVGRHRVARLLREAGCYARRKRKWVRTTDSRHALLVAPNVVNRQFCPKRPNQLWATDITYVPTKEGFLYLAVVLDLFSRRVVGFATSERIDAKLVLEAFQKGVDARRPGKGLLHHSDQGSQYACSLYVQMLVQRGIQRSMSRKGDCYDNAVVESFFSTLKTELELPSSWVTRRYAHQAIHEYIEDYYNQKRRHSTLGYLSPVAYEQQASCKKRAA